MVKAKAKKRTAATADDEVEMGGPSEGPGVSSSHKHKHDTHLLLDVRDPRVRFQNAVRAVIKLQRTTGKRATPVRPGLPRRDSWWQTSMSTDMDTSASPLPDSGLFALRGARVSNLIEELKALSLAQELLPHGALVRHVQFSPNGKYFATSRCVATFLGAVTSNCLCFGFDQLGQNCDDLSCRGESCVDSAWVWFVDRVGSSCRRRSRIIARSCTSEASSVKSLGNFPPCFKRGISWPPSGHPTVACSSRGSRVVSNCGPR